MFFSEGETLLADAGFGAGSYIITKKVVLRNMATTPAIDRYNSFVSKRKTIIEIVFGCLKSQNKILSERYWLDRSTQGVTFKVICILHNWKYNLRDTTFTKQ